MRIKQTILGLDIGSVSVGLALMNPKGELVRTLYAIHNGDVDTTLGKLLHKVDLTEVAFVAATQSTPDHIRCNQTVNNQIAVITAARHLHAKVGAILMVGGEKFNLIRFDTKGNYLGTRTNTSCAAGTGSFLDQQAGRLNLSGIAEMSGLAYKNQGERPQIASRCAVFAKTDLIHAQQTGFGIDQVCDGLCHGLAKNIVDTIGSTDRLNEPILICGGVAKNRIVVHHLGQLMGTDLKNHAKAHLYGAIGAALLGLAEGFNPAHNNIPLALATARDMMKPRQSQKRYYYPPLTLKLSRFPSFLGSQSYLYPPGCCNHSPVEVDLYESFDSDQTLRVWLGIDVGSTSTKAVLINEDKTVLAGFYTRTAGRPVQALQALLESIDNLIQKQGLKLMVLGSSTTGSGRKFIGRLINAELILDEITAHARAAKELDPKVDTIIEIGGQDAKFTTLQNGDVTYSVMNNVCAAGTGSFIEEQALKLNCKLSDYAARTENQPAPMSSDRCTVFMERDLNHYLSEGYAVEEVLASVLHSVRENYLLKVAVEARIGSNIMFQGATAKNKALVAAFEQRLNKPIRVSRFCHLTGAMGCALTLRDETAGHTRNPSARFRGIDLFRQKIPIRREVCELCNNHCKITAATVGNETVAFGFLCGRDYDTPKRLPVKSKAYNLLKERRKVFVRNPKTDPSRKFTLGLPAGVHLMEDLPMWRRFFDLLSIDTLTSETYGAAIKIGKGLAGAEFCAPMAAMHGHVDHLLKKTDAVFMPFYLEHKPQRRDERRHYCYYTQFLPSLTSQMADVDQNRLLTPLIRYLYTSFHTKKELYRVLNPLTGKTFLEISLAYDRAMNHKREGLKTLRARYLELNKNRRDIRVVLLGRPYTVLSPIMNNGIPGLFQNLGIDAFYQDMVSYNASDVKAIAPLLKEVHWHYAASILETAEKVAQSKGVYPVLMTAFKCAPDAFLTDYFRKIMDSHQKPFLILELDEHDSNVGYETRVEAAVRTFRSHHARTGTPAVPRYRNLNPEVDKTIGNRTIVIPNWDRITGSFLTANIRREGYRALLMEETAETIQESQKFNTGQCIPMNAIAQGYIHTIAKHGLDPSETVLWIQKSFIACNIRLYPHHIKTILNDYGRGFQKAGVYMGDISFVDISIRTAINAYFSYMFGGLIRKMGCKIRPYEVHPGQTDQMIEQSIRELSRAFLENQTKEAALEKICGWFATIPTRPALRPKVAIVGDLYARDNAVLNQNLIHFIEAHGGEVVTTPYSEYAKMVAHTYFKKWFNEGKYLNLISNKTMLATVTRWERVYYKYFNSVLAEPMGRFEDSPQKILDGYGLRIENTGESMDNLLKVHYLTKHHPDLSLFVMASPSLCCASLITEAMQRRIEEKTGVPVVVVTYDGTGGNKNDALVPYLKYPKTGSMQPSKRDQRAARLF